MQYLLEQYRRGLAGIALLSLVHLTGCASEGVKTYPVRGRVQFADGKPVKYGRIEFYHAEHDLTSRGAIQADGSFRLGTYSRNDGAPAGVHAVAITQLIMSGEAGAMPHDHGRHVDGQYADHLTSGIQLTVDASKDNEFQIVVEAVPARSTRR